jgi:HK97 family phage portal protein
MVPLKINDLGQISVDRTATKDFGTSDAYADNAGFSSLLGGPYGQSHSGLEVNPVTTLQSGVAYACIRILCSDVSKLPLRLMLLGPDGIWTEDRKHPLSRLIRRPNKRMTTYDMVVSWVMSLVLTGNSYTAILTGSDGKPDQLVPLLPTTVSVREDGIGNLFYYCLNRMFAHRHDNLFSEEEMIHIRTMSLDGGIRGASPTQLCAETIGLSLATQQLASMMFKNGGHFNGFLTSANAVTPDAIKLLSDTWNKNMAGLNNSYKTPVLGFGFDFKPVTPTAEQAQMIEARKMITEEVARIFGVPLYKLGGNEKSSYSAIDAQSQEYIDSTLIPITNPIEQVLNRSLLFDDEFDKYKFEFDFSALERGDLKTRSDLWHQLLGDGVFTVNDVLREMNRPSCGAEGDIRTKPLNVGTVGETSGLPNYQVNAPVKETETAEAPPVKKARTRK